MQENACSDTQAREGPSRRALSCPQDLSLEISRANDVVKALKKFCAVEVLDGDNKCAQMGPRPPKQPGPLSPDPPSQILFSRINPFSSFAFRFFR